MKKLFFIIAVLISSQSVEAQTRMTASADTNTNAVTTTHITNMAGDAFNFDVVTIQLVGTKVSGTVAGTAKLYGSIDGSNYKIVAADTLAVANVAAQSYIWTLDKSRYKYLKVEVATTGTQVSAWKAWLFGRKQPK